MPSNLSVDPLVITSVMSSSFKASTLTSVGAFKYLCMEDWCAQREASLRR